MERARRGKIARLPLAIRNEVCRRIMDGEPGAQILGWLNAHKQVRGIMEAQFGGAEIGDQNLTEWRQGGYKDWCEEQQRLDAMGKISEFAGEAVKAGRGIAEGAAAVAAGKLMSALDNAPTEDLVKLSGAIANIRSGDADARKIALKAREVRTREEKLALDEKRFKHRTVEMVLKFLNSEKAAAIARAPETDTSAKVEQLGALMFGEDWKA